jgi:phosphomannomutase
MGIKYYMAFTEEGKQAASTAKGITKIAESGPWVIYEVQDSEIISPLSVEPVVVNERSGDSRERWLELGTSYFQNGDEWPVMPVAEGPDSWQRMDVKVDESRVVGVAGRSGHQVDVVVPATDVEQRTVDPVTVSNVDIDQDTIRFRVDRVGEPVLIRVSYFPNWEVKGADAVYRAAPNYMVVVPTESQVVLTYGTSGIEYLGILMTLAGIGILILWWRRGSRIHYGVGLYGPSSGASDLTENSNVEALDVIVKAYDIRGLVPSQFNAQIANALGIAFAKFTDSETVLIARDMRTSGDLLCRAFADGVRRQGVNVIDLGLASTDLLYFAAGTLNAPGAMFTASHNPGEYNGIKMCFAGAKPIGADTGLAEIKAIAAKVLAGQAPRASEREGTIESRDMVEDFANHVVSFLGGADLGTMRVVADTANGMGGLVVPEVFRLIPGVELEVMYPELDGTFPNHPADPIQPENQKDLRARVVAGGFDVGLAFDGDADRVFVVDEKGEGLSGSTTTAILAAAVLRDNPGATILHNLICSRAVSEVIRENGGVPVRTKVGHSYIKQVMADTGAVFGGEHSAHYYFLDNFRADSGLIASMIVLAEIARSGKPLSELRKPFDRYAASGEINTSVNDPLAVIELVAEEFAEFPQDRLDGLTVDCGEWWFNLRPSNTEPLLRLNLEAADRSSCDMHVSRLLSLITGG